MKKRKILTSLLPLLVIAILFLIWFVVGVIVNNQYLFPSIASVFSSLVEVLKEGAFYLAYLSTLLRSVIAFAISFLLALGLALLSRKFAYFERAVSPIIKIIRALPTVAIALLLVFWTNSLIAPVIVTMLVVFPTMFVNVRQSLDMVDNGQIQMLKTFKVSQKEILFKVEIPQIAPSMLQAMGSGLSLNLKLMVAAEVLSATYLAIGDFLSNAKYNAEIAKMMAIVLICVLTGLLIELVFSLISKKVGRWQ